MSLKYVIVAPQMPSGACRVRLKELALRFDPEAVCRFEPLYVDARAYKSRVRVCPALTATRYLEGLEYSARIEGGRARVGTEAPDPVTREALRVVRGLAESDWIVVALGKVAAAVLDGAGVPFRFGPEGYAKTVPYRFDALALDALRGYQKNGLLG